MKTIRIISVLFFLVSVGNLFSQNITPTPVIINEIGVMPFNSSGYLELVVSGSVDDPNTNINLENWVIDNNSAVNENDNSFFALGDCFSSVPPGTMILLYDNTAPHPQINPSNDGMPNAEGVYQVAFNNPCISQCEMDEDFNCISSNITQPWDYVMPLSMQSDVVQLRAPDKSLRQAVRWGNGVFESTSDIRTSNLPEVGVISSIRLDARCDLFDYKYDVEALNGSPGDANSLENSIFITSFTTTTPPPPAPLAVNCTAIPGTTSEGGTIEVTIVGGYPPYKIEWEGPANGSFYVNLEGTYQIPNLPQGQYTINLSDAVTKCISYCEVFLGEQTEVALCEGECVSIGEQNPNFMNSYLWEPGDEFDNPNAPYQWNVCPEETSTYSLHIFDENCQLLEIREYEVVVNEPTEISLELTVGDGGICNFPANVEATEDFIAYNWSDGSTGSSNTIVINAVGSYEVTATDANGCTSVGQIEITDQNLKAKLIQNKLVDKGFYGVPITSIEQDINFVNNLNSTTDYASLNITIVDDLLNVADEFDVFLDNEFFNFLSENEKHSYVTSNINLCDADPNFFDQTCNDLNGVELGFWAHVWEDPDVPGDGILYVLGRSPNEEGFAGISAYGDMLVQEMLIASGPLEQESLDKEIIYVLQDDMADFYEFERTPENVNREKHDINCDPAAAFDIVAFNSAQVPINIGEGASLTYVKAEKIKSNADPSALMGFYRDGIRYLSIMNVGGSKHLGFKSDVSANFYDFPNLYGTDPLNVWRGSIEPIDPNSPASSYCPTVRALREYTFSQINWAAWNIDPNDLFITGAGDVISSFETSNFGNLSSSQSNADPIFSPTCLRPIPFDNFNSPAFILNDHYGYNGVLMYVNIVGNTYSWVYGVFEQGDTHTETYYRWNCNVGKWEVYTPPVDLKPEFDFTWAIFDAIKEIGHLALDGIGLIPILGEPADVLNGIWYYYEGEYLDAGISFGSVFIPLTVTRIVGSGKIVIKNLDTGEIIKTVVVDTKKLSESEYVPPGSGGIIENLPDVSALELAPSVENDLINTMIKRIEDSPGIIAYDQASDYLASILLNRAQSEKGFLAAWNVLSKAYPPTLFNLQERLWDELTIETIMGLRNNTTFMNALGTTVAQQDEVLAKIIQKNYLAPCVSCTTPGAGYLENIDTYLEQVENFVIQHIAGTNPTPGADQILSLMQNGQMYQIDAVAQLVRMVDEGTITNVHQFEPKLKDLLGNDILEEADDVVVNAVGDVMENDLPLTLHELKSWKKGTLNNIPNSDGFIEQHKAYIFALVENNDVDNPLYIWNNLIYSFDKKKLVDSGAFASSGAAEVFIKEKFQILLIENIFTWKDELEQAGGNLQMFYSFFGTQNFPELVDEIDNIGSDIYSFIKVQ